MVPLFTVPGDVVWGKEGGEWTIYLAFNINLTIDHWPVNSKFAFYRIIFIVQLHSEVQFHLFSTRDGAVWGGAAKVGAGPEYSPSHPLNLQQQQPRSAGGNVWRPSCGKRYSLPEQLVLKFF